MATFTSRLVFLVLIIRLLSVSGREGLQKKQEIDRAQACRQKALAAPRCSYRKIHYYRKSIELDPAFSQAHFELGEVYYDLAIAYGHHDLFEQAIQSFRSALELDPKMVEARYRLGAIYFLLRDFDACRRELVTARSLNPEYQPVQNSLRLLEEIAPPALP